MTTLTAILANTIGTIPVTDELLNALEDALDCQHYETDRPSLEETCLDCSLVRQHADILCAMGVGCVCGATWTLSPDIN